MAHPLSLRTKRTFRSATTVKNESSRAPVVTKTNMEGMFIDRVGESERGRAGESRLLLLNTSLSGCQTVKPRARSFLSHDATFAASSAFCRLRSSTAFCFRAIDEVRSAITASFCDAAMTCRASSTRC